MEKIVSDFIQARMTCYHAEEVQGDSYDIIVESIFYDCLVNEGQAYRERETYVFPMTNAGASEAISKYEELRKTIVSSLNHQAVPSGSNGKLVEGVDYSVLELPDKLWTLYVTQDGDYVETIVRFPNWFPCYRQVRSPHYPLKE